MNLIPLLELTKSNLSLIDNQNNFYLEDSEYENLIIKTKSISIKYDFIILNDIEGNLLYNQKLFIDSKGLKNGLRNSKDGFAFFGPITHYHGKIINDFILNTKDINDNDSDNISEEQDIIDKNIVNHKIIFAIFYDRTFEKFYLKSVKKLNFEKIKEIEINSILFYMKKNNIKIKSNLIIYFEDIVNLFFYIIVNQENFSINIKIIHNENKNIVEYNYNISDSPITIGENGVIKINGKKKVSILCFDNKNKYWVIKDKKEKIWVSCNNKIELKKTMLFKLNKDIFQAICSENN
jgi:hypothetical protein